ncbi:MAG: hypothetical protein ACK55I_03675, partial [bacterium]
AKVFNYITSDGKKLDSTNRMIKYIKDQKNTEQGVRNLKRIMNWVLVDVITVNAVKAAFSTEWTYSGYDLDGQLNKKTLEFDKKIKDNLTQEEKIDIENADDFK